MDSPSNFTSLTSLVQTTGAASSAHVTPAGSGVDGAPAAGVVTSLQPMSFKRDETAPPSIAYIPPNVSFPGGPPPGVRTSMYPENTRMGAPGAALPGAPQQQQQLQPAPQQPPAGQQYQPPAQQHPRMAYGGGQDMATNPRLDPAGEAFTYLPRTPASSPYGSAAYHQRVYSMQQAELAEFQESKRRAILYSRIFQSGLFPFLAGILFLVFTCAPVHEAMLRVLAPFGLVHDTGGGLTLSGQVVQSCLFGFAFSFAAYMV